MIPAQLDYIAAGSLDEAVGYLETHPEARVLAGGTGLLPALARRLLAPGTLIDLQYVPGLAAISPLPGGALRLGAMATLAAIAETRDLAGTHPALLDAIAGIGDPQVRNRATLGGSLAQLRPGGDLAAVLLACDAAITLTGPRGGRAATGDALLGGASRARLDAAEILTAVELPGECAGSAYERFRDLVGGYALCGVAALVRTAGDGTIGQCRLAVTGATAGVTRLTALEADLTGQASSAATLGSAALQAQIANLPFMDDRAASAEYRAHLTGVLAGRAIRRALERAGHARLH